MKKLEQIPEHTRVYVDETGVRKELVRERGRSKRGIKIHATRMGRMPKKYKVNVVAARRKDKQGNVLHIAPLCYKHTMNSDFFVEWFRTKLVKSIPKGFTITMDNATHHPKIRLANLAKRHGMKLLFLPTYSPDLNPIEKDWANLKKHLIDIQPDFVNFESAIYDYLS
jgi:transposase